MILEICAATLKSALNAQEGGATRIELCTNLEVGGLTPDYEMIREVRKLLSIPVYVLIRPRAGDFVYSKTELEQMKKDIAYCAQERCNGVVFGVLTEEGKINQPATYSLLEAAKFMDVTFHRAFDLVKDQIEGLNTLKELGIQRILTSGDGDTALKGFDRLCELVDEAEDDVIIMPGGGVRPENIQALRETGAAEFHSSAVTQGSLDSNVEVIRRLVSLLR